ncbi:leucine-rich repeat extensin-like protein 5 [Triticum dicoccoides]|uniref:leucine-rich repeat extensin-like protein 5 n=1 Tax=Triticum dicoccoides TaxID=85692 RepID=UPI001890892F|nr:leucine-rich repeat extensin-like protein 5 [Triticum dicoccoides]
MLIDPVCGGRTHREETKKIPTRVTFSSSTPGPHPSPSLPPWSSGAPHSVLPAGGGSGRRRKATRFMAKSGARKDAAQVRPSATSPPPQHSPGATASSFASRSPQLLFYPGAPTRSSASPSTPPHLYPPLMESSSANPTWRPMYTSAPEGLLSFGQLPPMNPYNFQPQPMHHHEQGYQNMENLHFVGASPHDPFSTPPPPPHSNVSSQSAPTKVDSKKKKRKVKSVDADESGARTAYRLPYTPEEHERLAGAWLECSLNPIDGNGKKSEQFWDDIAALYNTATPSNRKRDRNQLKTE